MTGRTILVAVILVVGIVFLFAPPKSRPPENSCYLTTTLHDGLDAPYACAPGYHMANVYELLDPSTFSYNLDLGVTSADAGNGPPAGTPYKGWIRGGNDAAGSGAVFQANCHAYQSNDPLEVGAVARLGYGSNAPSP
jgi:hypothetical protein